MRVAAGRFLDGVAWYKVESDEVASGHELEPQNMSKRLHFYIVDHAACVQLVHKGRLG